MIQPPKLITGSDPELCDQAEEHGVIHTVLPWNTVLPVSTQQTEFTKIAQPHEDGPHGVLPPNIEMQDREEADGFDYHQGNAYIVRQ